MARKPRLTAPKRKYVRKTSPKTPETVDSFVVYVCYPSSSKEYAYLCDIPGIRQGDKVIANHATVTVVRTAQYDPIATRWVKRAPSAEERATQARVIDIVRRLNTMFAEFDAMNRFALMAKTNPEAKRLLSELKSLRQSQG